MIDSNLLVEVGGGWFIGVFEVKLEMLTPIFMVTSSSPDTNGVIFTLRFASTGIYC
jgi:hypothetical protein